MAVGRCPRDLLGADGAITALPFEPAPELLAWARETFIEEDAPLLNEDHAHLREASLGFLWTSVPNARGGNGIVGQAEIPSIQGGKWARARFFQQVEGWFGLVPDFLITLDAGFADQASDATFCALVEHELYHCGQQVTAWGEPTGTGLKAVDYLFADPVLVPASERALLAEQVADLPCFLGFWSPEALPEPGGLPALAKLGPIG